MKSYCLTLMLLYFSSSYGMDLAQLYYYLRKLHEETTNAPTEPQNLSKENAEIHLNIIGTLSSDVSEENK